MKRNMISVALFAVLATMAVSCQKENFMEPQSSVISQWGHSEVITQCFSNHGF